MNEVLNSSVSCKNKQISLFDCEPQTVCELTIESFVVFVVSVSVQDQATSELKDFDKTKLKHTETAEKQSLPDPGGKNQN